MIDIDEGNLKQGLLGLVIAVVEIVKDALATQAFKRVENGRLSEAEMERLGEALCDLDVALAQIKEEHGVAEHGAESAGWLGRSRRRCGGPHGQPRALARRAASQGELSDGPARAGRERPK